MKLRNKKTGKIIEPMIHTLGGKEFNSLAELNEEWEDVGTFWFLNGCGDVCRDEDDKHKEEVLENTKQIGNYFNTKEEAEKAAEKLKAWKRLRDKGFEIESWTIDVSDNYYKSGQIQLNLNNVRNREWDEFTQITEIKNDLDLLFGGEE